MFFAANGINRTLLFVKSVRRLCALPALKTLQTAHTLKIHVKKWSHLSKSATQVGTLALGEISPPKRSVNREVST